MEPVRPLPSRASRGSRATRKREASAGGGFGRPEWRDRRPTPGVSSLTRAAAVSQSVQDHAARHVPSMRKARCLQVGDQSIGAGICAVMPLSSNANVKGDSTHGGLARSVLDSWGSFRAPDVFQLAFPSREMLQNFTQRWGGKGDARLIVLTPSEHRATYPQLPSPLRIFEHLRQRHHMPGSRLQGCSWFASLDADGYLNPKALREQLREMTSTKCIFFGRLSKRSATWPSQLYAPWWSSGATGHFVSVALLDSVDWRRCQRENWNWKRNNMTKHAMFIGHDDVQTSSCIYRRLDNYSKTGLRGALWTQAPAPNAVAAAMLNRMDPKWAAIAAAHRMTPTLNLASARLLEALNRGR